MLSCSSKSSTFPLKEPPAEYSDYGPDTCSTQLIYFIFLPRQQPHGAVLSLSPEQSFPPQVGFGLAQRLVHFCVPIHVALHDPHTHELHSPSTTYTMIIYVHNHKCGKVIISLYIPFIVVQLEV